MANDINGSLRNVLPGNIDEWNRVYATVADANDAIPSNVVGGRNFREGKVVQIGTVTNKEEYRWQGGYADGNLTPYNGESIQGATSNTINSYLRYQSNSISVTTLSGYSVQKYDVIAGGTYKISGSIRGLNLASFIFTSSEVVDNSTLLLLGDIINTNVSDVVIDKTVVSPQGALYLFVTRNNTFEKLSVKKISEPLADIQKKINSLVPLSTFNSLNSRVSEIEQETTDTVRSPTSSTPNSYVRYRDGLITNPTLTGYVTERYSVTEGESYDISGYARGTDVVVYGFFNNSIVSNEAIVSLGLISKNNTTGVDFNEKATVPSGATFLIVTRVVVAGKTVTVTKLSAISTELQKLKDEINTDTPPKVNLSWLAMNSLNKKLQEQYSQHFIDVQAALNNRYDFGDISVTADFTVPALNGSVNIPVSSTTLLTVNKKVCIGTKTFYDTYTISAINGLIITCILIENNTKRSGMVLNSVTTFTNQGVDIVNKIKVFTYDDLMAYHSNEIPKSLSPDSLHPNDAGYAIIGKVIASRINLLFGKPLRVITWGDSFTIANKYQPQIVTLLGSSIVNKGQYGDRVEHILQRFIVYMETYTPTAGDMFLFYMGTNNLADITRQSTDAQKMFYNSSYTSIFLDAVEKISTLLPLGNWMVCSGHSNSLAYKENI